MTLSGGKLWSQEGVFKLDVNYKAAIPLGDFRNVVSNTSGRGWDAAVMYGVSDKVSIGLGTGSQDFYQKYARQILHESGSDLSAVITNSIQTAPVLAKGKYSFTQSGFLQPFAAVGAGANFIHYRKYYGEFVDEDSRVGFAAQGELGLQVPFGSSRVSGFHISAGYNYMPYKFNDVNGLNNVFFKAGLTFGL
jgi:hypothetical protein